MRQEDWDRFARYVLACSLHGVFSYSGSLSIPGRPQTSRVREGPSLNKATRQDLISHGAVSGAI
jgi:hypothetical protein